MATLQKRGGFTLALCKSSNPDIFEAVEHDNDMGAFKVSKYRWGSPLGSVHVALKESWLEAKMYEGKTYLECSHCVDDCISPDLKGCCSDCGAHMGIEGYSEDPRGFYLSLIDMHKETGRDFLPVDPNYKAA